MSYTAFKKLMWAGWSKSGHLSDPIRKFQSAAEYGKVIMMGSKIFPWLLQILRNGEGDIHVIFIMLCTLTPEHPVIPEGSRAHLDTIKQLWLELAYEKRWISKTNNEEV